MELTKIMIFCGIHHNMKIPGIHSNKNFFSQRNYEGCLSIVLFSLSSASDNYFSEKAQGYGFENKGTEALSFRQIYGCFFSGSRQVNALRGVCGSDGVKRVVCR